MLGPLLAAVLAAAAPPAHPCRTSLPDGPAVSASIVLRTSCGGFRLAEDGSVTRLPRGWFARRSGGTGRTYGADLALRRNRAGRFFLLRHGRIVWRSTRLYPNDGGDVAFGPHAFAFASYRRGVFLTNMIGPERRVVRGRRVSPLGFLRSGELLVSGGPEIRVVGQDGRTLRRFRYRARNGFAFDEPTGRLFFVTPKGVLAAVRGTGPPRLARRLRGVDGAMSLDRQDLLVFNGARDLAVVRPEGTVVARTQWLRGAFGVSDSGVSVSDDGRAFAFRLTDARPGSPAGSAAVFVLRAGGDRPHAVYRHRVGQSGCWTGATLSWHGGHLLYASSDGRLAVLDSRAGTALDLAPLARALPRRAGERASAYWASDL